MTRLCLCLKCQRWSVAPCWDMYLIDVTFYRWCSSCCVFSAQREQSAVISWCAMTGSLKAKPLHAVPAALRGLMGDQWAVDSANSRGVQQIHRKARERQTQTSRRHMKACRESQKSNWYRCLILKMKLLSRSQVWVTSTNTNHSKSV